MAAIAVDAGTTVIKAVAYDGRGAVREVSTRSVTVERPRAGWAVQSMADVWAAVAAAVREVGERLPEPPEYLALTAQGDGVWLVDRRGKPIEPAVLWSDGRAHTYVEQWQQSGVLDEAFGITGSRISTGMPNTILAWMRDHDRQRLDRAGTVLTCAGWLFRCLTGAAVVDESDASAPWLDIRRRHYADRLLDSYGLGWAQDLLPELRDDASRVATLTEQAADQVGLAAGLPVVYAPYDICSTAIGAGARRPGQACCILGTTISTEIVTDRVDTRGEPVGITVALGVPGRYLRAYPTLNGTEVLRWAARLLGVSSAPELMALAERGRLDGGGVRFLPYLSPAGERAPFFDASVRGSFSGLSLDATREDVARAVVEGLTMTIRDCLAAAPTRPERLALSGGGAASPFWCQLIADVTGLTVTLPSDAEVGARGAWLVGQVALGSASDLDTEADRHLRPAAPLQPDPLQSDFYGQRYADFVELRERSRAGHPQLRAR